MFQVQHEDHVDTLVHNSKTGDMALAHDCGDCGESDLHGSLFLVSKREWGSDDNDVNGNGRGTNNNNSNSNRNGNGNIKKKMNFYEVQRHP